MLSSLSEVISATSDIGRTRSSSSHLGRSDFSVLIGEPSAGWRGSAPLAQKAARQDAYAKRINVRVDVRLDYLMEAAGQRPHSRSLFSMLFALIGRTDRS